MTFLIRVSVVACALAAAVTPALSSQGSSASGLWMDVRAGVGIVNVPQHAVGGSTGPTMLVSVGGVAGAQVRFGGEVMLWFERGTQVLGGGLALPSGPVEPVRRERVTLCRRTLAVVMQWRPARTPSLFVTGGAGFGHYEGLDDVIDGGVVKDGSSGGSLRAGIGFESAIFRNAAVTMGVDAFYQGTQPASRLLLITVGVSHGRHW